jgi:acyl-homoserine-lactone acylase
MRVLLLLLAFASTAMSAPKAEILWDQYGVPHIFAADRESMFYANGWAQAQAQGNLLLHLYGESRGRGAEYWGPDAVALDRWVQTNGVPERAKAWYAAQDPTFRKYLDAFARGISDYGKAHPETIAPEDRVVLPVDGVDVLGHCLRAVHYMYMGSMQRMRTEVNAALRNPNVAHVQTPEEQEVAGESNTWTIGPAHSASGNSMLIINPHLAWGDTFYRYMAMHLVGPGYDLYGAPQIGFPTPVVGFNRHMGWGRTVNTIDTVDFYKLTVKDDQYEYDGQWKPFEHATKVIKIKQPDGSMKEETLAIRRSIQGPVVYDERGMKVAMRVAGIDRPKMLEQWFRMGEAENLEQFRSALSMISVPMWNQSYADDQGHSMIVCNGTIPRRKVGDYPYWSKVVAGDTSETMWDSYLTLDELPTSLDPPSGWSANTNEPPWTMTFPQLDPKKYAAYVAPVLETMPQLRTLRSLRMINEDSTISYEKMLADKFSTRMELADKVLPDLLKGTGLKSEAAQLLAKWDGTTEVDSRGAVLFQMFADSYFKGVGGIANKLRVKYDRMHPLESGFGLADPEGAAKILEATAEEVKKTYGSIDVKWGDVYRFGSGTGDTPGNGGAGNSGIFRTITYSRKVGNRYYAAHGDTFYCAVEFGKSAQTAQCSTSYGNSSQPGSPHLTDQLPLMSAKKLIPVWRERKDIEAHLEKRERF